MDPLAWTRSLTRTELQNLADRIGDLLQEAAGYLTDPSPETRQYANIVHNNLQQLYEALLRGAVDYAIDLAFRVGECRAYMLGEAGRKEAIGRVPFSESQIGRRSVVEKRFAPLKECMLDFRQRKDRLPSAGECWQWLFREDGGGKLTDPVSNSDQSAGKKVTFRSGKTLIFGGFEKIVTKIGNLLPPV